MTPRQAVQNRDAVALNQALETVERAIAFRNQELPQLSADDCRWFWQQIMHPSQLTQTLNAVRDVCASIAKELDLVNGVHYSLGMVDELPTLICPKQVADVFYAKVPRERHSVLRFYLQIAV